MKLKMNIKKQEYRQRYYKKYPWLKHYENICKRCNGENENYKKLGRKCLLTAKDIRFLWLRDKAYLLEKPSIHRIDNDKDYTLKNCRFMELRENIRLGAGLACNKKRINAKPVIQYTLDGKFIKRYKSLSEAARELKTHVTNIANAAKHRRNIKQSCGFSWKFPNP